MGGKARISRYAAVCRRDYCRYCQASQIEMIMHGSGRDVLHIPAGTSVPSRTREEVNSFHVLNIHNRSLLVQTFTLGSEVFFIRQDICRLERAGQ